MYIIQYSKEDQLSREIKTRLEDLSLAFKEEISNNLSNTKLKYSDEVWTDRGAIFEHLNQTEEKLKRWHYCNC